MALVLDGTTGGQLRALQHPPGCGWIMGGAWTSDGKALVSSACDGKVRLWDPDRSIQTGVYAMGPPGQTYIYRLSVCPNGSFGATANGNGTVGMFRLPTTSRLASGH